MLGRALLKRCPLCGAKKLFTGWFRMKERCPGCGYRFEREEGFFLGAYVINLAIAQGMVILLAVVPLIVRLASDPDASIAPFIAGGIIGAVVAPMIFYPWSKTIWTAFDLMLRPVHVTEPADRS
jgi:Mn2+/Fe2+ NRAMP family transporter